jgi:AcrR family transcriptional regulator
MRARTAEDKDRKKRLLLDGARDLFLRKGFHDTTIEAIAAGAGVSAGTFYLYFRNKMEAYKAIQEEGLDILSPMIEQVTTWPGMSPLARLSEIARTYFRFYQDYREYFDILAMISATPGELKETDTDISRSINSKTRALLKMVEGAIREGVESGVFKEVDTWKITSVFWGLMDGMLLLAERNNIENVIGVGLEDLIRQGLEMTFYGIVRENTR